MTSPYLNREVRDEKDVRAASLRSLHAERARALVVLNSMPPMSAPGLTEDERADRSIAIDEAWRRFSAASDAVTRAEKGQAPRRKFYTIFQQWPDELEPFTVEGPMLLTPEDVVAALSQINHAFEVFHGEEDVTEQFRARMEAEAERIAAE